jgi:hypothetical protein
MIHKFIIIALAVVMLIITNGCKSTPGQGGNAQIKGTYWERKHDPYFTYVTGRYPAVNKTVYLFFGDDTSPGMSVNTNSNGEFAFTYLRTGKYKVSIYNQRLATATQSSQYPTETYVFLNSKSEIKALGLDTINQ